MESQVEKKVVGGAGFRDVRGFVISREVGEFLSGALAGAMTKAILAPLETIRHIAGSFLEVIEHQGWQGLWAGNSVNLIRIIPTQSIEFGTFECVKRAMPSMQEKWNESGGQKVQIGQVTLNLSLSWISHVAAGVASTLVCHPLEVLKDRLTVSPDNIYPSLRVALSKIYRDGSVSAFSVGLSPILNGMLAYSTSYYFIYDTVKNSNCSANNKTLNRLEMLLIGAFAGENLIPEMAFI